MQDWFQISFKALPAIFLTAAGIYISVILFTRIAGKRSFSTMSSFDFAMTVAVGSLIATTVLSKNVSLWHGMIGLGSLYVLQVSVAILRRYRPFRNSIDNSPLLLMRNGEILSENLRKARLTEGDLRNKLRAANVLSLSQVRAVVFETTGDVSVLHSPDEDQELEEWLIKDVNT